VVFEFIVRSGLVNRASARMSISCPKDVFPSADPTK
jgi:hypothetical protein